MNRRGLHALVRVRRNAVEEVQRRLVACLRTEAEAERAAEEAERVIARETDAASCVTTGDTMVEAFAAWLPEARRRASAARSAVEQRQSESARLRATLAACRVAQETVETLQREQLAQAATDLARRVQRDLDETRPHCVDATDGGGK